MTTFPTLFPATSELTSTRKADKTKTKMNVNTLLLISILLFSNVSTTPVENKSGQDFLQGLYALARKDGSANLQSLKSILVEYVEAKYPGIEKNKQGRILKVLTHKVKERIMIEIMKKRMARSRPAKEDLLARMLK